MMKCKWSMVGQIVGSLLLSECRYVQWRGPQQPFGARAPIFLDYHLYTPCRCPARPGHDKQKFMLACTFIASLVKPLVAATAVHREREQQHHHHHQTTSPPHQHHLLLLLRRQATRTDRTNRAQLYVLHFVRLAGGGVPASSCSAWQWQRDIYTPRIQFLLLPAIFN